MLKIENISKKYGKSLILNNISFQLKQGEILTILGKSGIGKSTLLKCICGLEKVDAGEILLNGQDINTINPKELHQKIGIVFQDFNLFEHLTVLENLTLGLVKIKKMNLMEAQEKAEKLLKKFDLIEKKYNYPDELSGGQKQRVAIIRTILMSPKVVLLDEPTSSLDKATKEEIISLIKEMSKDGLSIIIVTHEEELIKKLKTLFIISRIKIFKSNIKNENI